ncbi:gliding motility-associated C-terminal domain-containing protein [Flavobacteriales bacterium]|nr:gliding motility-associated C-terminal domain-containing protein [Flavobacteriales bacterium]
MSCNKLKCPHYHQSCSFLAVLIFLVFVGIQTIAAQTISDCSGAVFLCGDLYTETEATLNTGDIYEYTGACNASLEQSSLWYTFTVQENGLLSFIIDPLNPMDDYDWGLFDITTGGCEGIGTPILSPEVGCNSFGLAPPEPNGATGISSANGGTGNSNGPGNLNGPAFNADLPVQSGETYALVVMNWTNSLEGYTIDFGQSTASLYDEVSPAPDSCLTDCELQRYTVTLDESVLLSTVEPEDFELEGPAGELYTFSSATALDLTGDLASVFELELDGTIVTSGAYQLRLTDDANGIEDPCGNIGEGFAALELTVLEPPLGWDAQEVILCPDDNASLSVNSVVTQPTNTAYTYLWSYDMAGAPIVAEGAGMESMGDGTYSVVISTVPACYLGEGSFVVLTEECSLTLPNVITPGNGDALNEAFFVEGLDAYPGSAIRIFNRWGELLYSSQNFGASAGWAPNADEASEGTYYYELRILQGNDDLIINTVEGEQSYAPSDNPVRVITGSFSLLR